MSVPGLGLTPSLFGDLLCPDPLYTSDLSVLNPHFYSFPKIVCLPCPSPTSVALWVK